MKTFYSKAMTQLKNIRVFIFLIFLVSGQLVLAQYHNLNFRNFNSSNGLPGNDVECLYQDKRGYIWIGTRFGLSMFDGTHFRNFLHDPTDSSTLGGSRVYKIQEDKKGGLWVVTENFGLSRIDLKTYRITNYPISTAEKLEDRFINTLFVDDNGKIWTGAETGICLFDPINGQYKRVGIEGVKEKDKETISFLKDKEGTVWAAGYTGQIFYKTKDASFFKVLKHPHKIELIYQLINNANCDVYLTSSNGIFELKLDKDESKTKLVRVPELNSLSNITNLAIDQNGIWWIANPEKGIQFFEPDKKKLTDLNISWLSPLEPGISIWKDILIDQDGGVWLGGEFGVYYYNQKYNNFDVYKPIAKFNEQFSLGKYVGISSYEQDVIAVSTKGVGVFNRTANEFVSLKIDPLVKGQAFQYYGIIQKEGPIWWIATSKGVLELKKRNNDYLLTRPLSLNNNTILMNNPVYAITASAGRKYWFATPRNGLLVFDERTKNVQNIFEFGKGEQRKRIDHLDFVTASSEGDIAVGHHRGFAVQFKGEKDFLHVEQLIRQNYDFSKLSVYDMEYKDGYLWVASESDGLLRFDFRQKELKVFTMDDGLISNSITSIHGMGKEKLVIGTNRGMSIMHIPTETFTTFLRKDGLPAEEFETAVDHDIDEREFFLATSKGIVSFFADKIRQSVIKPKLVLYAINRNGQQLNDSLVNVLVDNPRFKLKYNESLSLQFSTLNYSRDNDFLLRFKMNDEEEWQNSPASETLSLFNLDAGVYNIVVQVIGKRSGIMSNQIKIELEVLPNFFKTRLFRFMLLFFILLLLYFPVNRFFEKRLSVQKIALEKKQLLEQERVRIAMDLHDDIGGNLTALTLMTNILKEKKANSDDKLLIEKIGEASDKMVQDMNEIVWALNISNDSLISLMSYIREYVSNRLSAAGILLEISEPLNYPEIFVSGRIRRNVFMIVKEIINNAIKYAGTSKVDIKITLDPHLKISIADNGKGMPEELTNQAIKGGGNGLNNIKKRAAMLNATIRFKNEKGLTVLLDLPLDQISNP